MNWKPKTHKGLTVEVFYFDDDIIFWRHCNRFGVIRFNQSPYIGNRWTFDNPDGPEIESSFIRHTSAIEGLLRRLLLPDAMLEERKALKEKNNG